MLPATELDYNAAGQHHASVYVQPLEPLITLRGLDGKWTGHMLSVDQLRYDDAEKARAFKHGYADIDGLARIDYHEELDEMLFHRGGTGYVDSFAVKYGHILRSDLNGPLGKPVPSGDGRGAPAPDLPGLYAMRCLPMPAMYYKPTQPDGSVPWGALWWTYSDMGAEWGGDIHYMPLLWSFLNVAGGGHVRGLLHDGHHVRLADVPRIHMPIWDQDGVAIGEAVGAYVRTSTPAWGWVLWAHKTIYTGNTWTYHADRVG